MTKQNLSKMGWAVMTLLLGFFVMTSSYKPAPNKAVVVSEHYLKENAKLTDFNDFDFENEDFEEIVDRVNMADPCLGQISIFAGNYAPRGWAFCDGQLLPINQNQALYSILGTMYGGDGRTSFGLPDLRGRAAVHVGTNNGRTFAEGAKGGSETSYFSVNATTVQSAPIGRSGNVTNISSVNKGIYDPSAMQPFLTLNYIIALQGVFCSRS